MKGMAGSLFELQFDWSTPLKISVKVQGPVLLADCVPSSASRFWICAAVAVDGALLLLLLRKRLLLGLGLGLRHIRGPFGLLP